MAEETETGTNGAEVVPAHSGHPTPSTYLRVAIILAAITAAEVGVFYVEGLGKGIIPVLVLLSGVKFTLVAMFYMHLRYDARLFSGLFVGGLVLAFLIGLAILALFKYFATG